MYDMYVYVCVCTYVCMYVCMYVCKYVWVCMHECMSITVDYIGCDSLCMHMCVVWHLLFNSCRRKAASGSEKAPSASEISPVSSDHTKQTGDVTRTPSKGENGGSKERSSSVNEEGIQSSASVTLSVEGNRESSPSRDAAAIDKPSVDCEGQCSRVQVDVEVHTVKQNDPEAHTLHPESTLKSPEAQNCQANNEAGASSVAERDDNQRRQDGEVSVNPLCPSQEKTVVDPCRSEVVRTSSTEDVNASVEQTPSTPVCPDGDRNSAVIPGPVKSVDPDNSEDGIYRVFSTCPCLCA